MRFAVVIPARYRSTRLPGKPLLEIAGKPMVQHVYERAIESGAAAVTIATDDPRIVETARAFGADVEITADSHRSGTDRIAEVVRRRGDAADTIIVNVQGDEPEMSPRAIAQVAALLAAREQASIATLCERITDVESVFDPSVVKVVLDADGYALYFSRAPIPWHREAFSSEPRRLPADTHYHRHLGIYAYRVGYLLDLVERPPGALETAESLEQLRALGHGARIAVAESVEPVGPGVDTPRDLERLRARLESGQ